MGQGGFGSLSIFYRSGGPFAGDVETCEDDGLRFREA